MLFSYPDFVAVAVVIVLNTVVALGAKCSTRFSAVFVVINILLLCFVTICGVAFGDVSNLTANLTSAELDHGVAGGFMPFGWAGILAGTATCFWAFSGFENISCAVEESHSPQRHIPLATVLTMLIVTVLYIGTAAGMTLLAPCEQLDTGAPLPSAFAYAGLEWGRYIIAIGPLCGFTTTFVTGAFAYVRILFAMAEDGLLWSWCANVNKFSQVPIMPIVLCGLLQCIVACVCDIRDLISFGVNIVLLSYAAACVAVIVLRYSDAALHQSQADGDKSQTRKDLSLADNSNDARELCSVASDEICLYPEHSMDDNVSLSTANGDGSSSSTAAQTDKDTENRESAAGNSEDGPLECPDSCLLPDDIHSASGGSLLPRCGCLEPFMICRSPICIKASVALMLMSMLGLAFILVYGVVPLESGLWWAVVLAAVAASGVAFFLTVICIHRQTLQTAVLMVSVCSMLLSGILIQESQL